MLTKNVNGIKVELLAEDASIIIAEWAVEDNKTIIPVIEPITAEELYDMLETKGTLLATDRPRPKRV